MQNTSPLQNALHSLEKLNTEEKLKLAEAIGHSIPDEFSVWLEKKVDELSETDEEDIRLAEEALAEYHANPGSAVTWDEFYKQQMAGLTKSKTDIVHSETDEDDIRLAEEALTEYHANPGSAIEGDLFFRQLKEKYGKKDPVTV
jgi:hypothetical protein